MPAMNISRTTPISARSRTIGEQGRRSGPVGRRHRRVREQGPAEDVEHRRPEDQPDEDLAEDRRLSDAVREGARELGGRDDDGEQQEELQEVAHGGSWPARGARPGHAERGNDKPAALSPAQRRAYPRP